MTTHRVRPTSEGIVCTLPNRQSQNEVVGPDRLLRSGVVAGLLGDAHLAKALNAMHAAPERPWTLQGLAGMSRARFAAHFGGVVGEPAIEYLAG